MIESEWSVGIDIGGTKTLIAQVDALGRIRGKEMIKTPLDPEEMISIIANVIQKFRFSTNTSPQGVGIGIAGQVEPKSGTLLFGPNLDWRNIPFKEKLTHLTNLPVCVINDVRAATIGEWLYGAGTGIDHLVCLFIGTGIGGGIVSDGKLLEGYNNSAGEIGHITIDLFGPECTCGNCGCLEAFAGGWAIARKAREVIQKDQTTGAQILELAGGRLEAITAQNVFQSSHQGDPLAMLIVQETIFALVAGAVSLVNAFNPHRLILGGGIVDGLPHLAESINQGVRQRALAAATAHLEILNARLGNEAGAIGAAVQVMRNQLMR